MISGSRPYNLPISGANVADTANFAGSGLANPSAFEMYPSGGGNPLAGIMAKYGGQDISRADVAPYSPGYTEMPIMGRGGLSPYAGKYGGMQPGAGGAKGGGAKGGGRAMPGPSAISKARAF